MDVQEILCPDGRPHVNRPEGIYPLGLYLVNRPDQEGIGYRV